MCLISDTKRYLAELLKIHLFTTIYIFIACLSDGLYRGHWDYIQHKEMCT